MALSIETAQKLINGIGTLDDLSSFDIWKNTAQGHDYWKTIAQAFEDAGLESDNIVALSDEAIVLSCIAFDNPLKGLDILLNTFHIVREGFPKLHLIIVGVDEQTSALPLQANALGLSDCVHWAGIRDAGWQILNAADIYLQPSRSEGLPLSIMAIY